MEVGLWGGCLGASLWDGSMKVGLLGWGGVTLN